VFVGRQPDGLAPAEPPILKAMFLAQSKKWSSANSTSTLQITNNNNPLILLTLQTFNIFK